MDLSEVTGRFIDPNDDLLKRGLAFMDDVLQDDELVLLLATVLVQCEQFVLSLEKRLCR